MRFKPDIRSLWAWVRSTLKAAWPWVVTAAHVLGVILVVAEIWVLVRAHSGKQHAPVPTIYEEKRVVPGS